MYHFHQMPSLGLLVSVELVSFLEQIINSSRKSHSRNLEECQAGKYLIIRQMYNYEKKEKILHLSKVLQKRAYILVHISTSLLYC